MLLLKITIHMPGCERTSEQRPPISRHFVKADRINGDIVYTIDILTANGFRIMHYKFMFCAAPVIKWRHKSMIRMNNNKRICIRGFDRTAWAKHWDSACMKISLLLNYYRWQWLCGLMFVAAMWDALTVYWLVGANHSIPTNTKTFK